MKKLLLVLAIGAFAACGGKEEAPAETPAETTPAATTPAEVAPAATTPAASAAATPAAEPAK